MIEMYFPVHFVAHRYLSVEISKL